MKQAPQNFIKVFNVDDFMLTSKLLTSNRKIKIASKEILPLEMTVVKLSSSFEKQLEFWL